MKKRKKKLYLQQKKRSLKKIVGNFLKPRLSVFRSHSHMYAQLIDDQRGETLVSCSTLEKNFDKTIKKTASLAAAFAIGQELAIRAKKKDLNQIVFDKGRFAYHGRVQSLAQGARDQGLIF